MIVYLRSHKRRPVWAADPATRPSQIPLNWCIRCGREVYTCAEDHCLRCIRVRTEEKENEDVQESL